MWPPPFLGVYVLVAMAKPLSWEKVQVSMKLHHLWKLHHQAGYLAGAWAPSLTSSQRECLQFQSDSSSCSGIFVFTPFPRLWVLGHAWFRGCAHLLIKERYLCTFSLTHRPALLPSASVPPAAGHVFSPCISLLAFQKTLECTHGGHFWSRTSHEHQNCSVIPGHVFLV